MNDLPHIWRRTLAACLVAAALIAGGCTVVPPGEEAPSPRPAVPSRPVMNSPAVRELSARAKQALSEGRFDDAVQLLERAIGIEPRNGGLWTEMARVRYAQGNYEQAMELARRSNALPDPAPGLKTQNDELIKASRKALAGAKE